MSASSLNVAVLMGGPSAEAEVSHMSAREVAAALTSAGHRATLLELDGDCARALMDLAPDVAFPALHGPPGEDGTVQGFLELLGIPCVGSGVHGSAVAMDKSLAKACFKRAGLPVAAELVVDPGADLEAAAGRILEAMGERVVIKPLRQGSALGTTRLPNGGNVLEALREALRYGHGALVEPYVLGREITVGVLDLHGETAAATPVIEIRTATDQWYDYANRYTPGQSEHVIPAPLPAQVLSELQTVALRAHSVLGLRDLSRADFLVTDSNGIVLLEVNTLPGMTPTSLFPDGAAAMGLDFPALTDRLVRSAVARGVQPD